jgi:hypothetical protein
MAYYRIYFVGEDGHIRRAREIHMPSDAEAIAFAEASAEGQRVEVWNRARLVSRIDPVRQQA